MLKYFSPLLAALFMALFAQIDIDLPLSKTGIPFTGQSFAVLLVAAILGRKNGSLSVLVYFLLGIIGLPVFAKAASGYEVFLKGSGGFLIGFWVAAYLVGWLADKNWRDTFFNSLLLMLIGTTVILFFGVFRLSILYGFSKGLEYGFYPFIWGAIFKIFLGALVLQIFQRLTVKIEKTP